MIINGRNCMLLYCYKKCQSHGITVSLILLEEHNYVDRCVHYLMKRKETPKTLEPVNIQIQTKQYSNVEYKQFIFNANLLFTICRIYRRMSSTVGLHVPPNVLLHLKVSVLIPYLPPICTTTRCSQACTLVGCQSVIVRLLSSG